MASSFKRYQIAKVYRRDNPAKGRYLEFYQCDFDITGPGDKMGPDGEAIYVLTELLDEVDIGEYEAINSEDLLGVETIPDNQFISVQGGDLMLIRAA